MIHMKRMAILQKLEGLLNSGKELLSAERHKAPFLDQLNVYQE